MEGARSILLSITGGRDLSLWEVNEAAKAVSEAAHPDANIIFGAMVDEKLDDQVWVTVVATGYGDARPRARASGARAARAARADRRAARRARGAASRARAARARARRARVRAAPVALAPRTLDVPRQFIGRGRARSARHDRASSPPAIR